MTAVNGLGRFGDEACPEQRLRAMGCPLGQGYLLGRPQDPAAMLELVAAPKVTTVAVAA